MVTIAPGYVATPLTRVNRHPMPFLMSPEAFAARAVACIERGERLRVIPWQMAGVARVLRLLPGAWFDRLLEGQPRKPRQSDLDGSA